MDFEKEYIPDEQEDFDTDFDTKEITPIKSLRSDPPPQYFTNIDGKYCKDVAGREELDELKALVDDVPWQPLEDGYSNFWFELTEDTLSPWLNFSAKTTNATIDWGDGSGEQSLDTLNPTHTYAKAGKYLVKVKGVTGIARVIADEQLVSSYPYLDCLKYIELNNEVTALSAYVFANLLGLKELYITNNSITSAGAYVFSIAPLLEKSNLNVLGTYAYRYCTKLRDINLGNATTVPTYGFDNCINLLSITIPATVTEIGNQVFRYCFMLKDIHIQATTPPTIGTNVFLSANNYYTIYVPVGTLSAYQTAWSEYADHILEEGQTPNRAMLAKFNSVKTEETDEPQDDMR